MSRFFGRKTADEVLASTDLSGRVMMVTGADSGIGFETARALARRGARVWVGCLKRASGEDACARIRTAHPSVDVQPIAFDLGDLSAVRAAAAALDEPELHALVCNAGVYGGPYALTKDGFERTLGVCYVDLDRQGLVAPRVGLSSRAALFAVARAGRGYVRARRDLARPGRSGWRVLHGSRRTAARPILTRGRDARPIVGGDRTVACGGPSLTW